MDEKIVKYLQGLCGIFLIFLSTHLFAEPQSVYWKSFKPDTHDTASLQRGARIFMNYCSGCHSLRYMSYNQLGEGLRLVNEQGKLDNRLLQENLIFSAEKPNAVIISSMNGVDATKWFGTMPPDLTLITKIRNPNWVYNYLRGFYQDSGRLTGANNLLLPNTAMPNILVELQGIQLPVYRKIDSRHLPVIDHLAIVTPGVMTPLQFDSTVADVVNFLTYTAEPQQNERYRIGKWVLLFLLIFVILVFYLKKCYWTSLEI